MGSMRGYKYNGAIDRINVQEGVRYRIDDKGVMFTHDMFDPIPQEFFHADTVFIDPPWNLINVKTFYTKANKVYTEGGFDVFMGRIFHILRELTTKGQLEVALVEMGKQYVNVFAEGIRQIFGNVRVYESKYYNKYPCFIIQGWKHAGAFVDIPDERKDELKMIDDYIRIRNQSGKHTILDFCNGRGATSRTAYKYGMPFICTEFNINRFAVAVEDLMKMGATVEGVTAR